MTEHVGSYLERLVPDDAVGPISRAFGNLYGALRVQTHLPPATLELCRLRLIQLHRGAAASQTGDSDAVAEVGEAQRAALSRWSASACFSDGEKACLAFTEVYVMDAAAITDELAAAVKEHFGDSGLVMLIEALGLLDGVIRLNLLWPDTPVREQH